MTDIYADARIVAQRHREQGATEERTKIVAWLRDNPDHLARKGWLADAIEAGEHLK